jgi:hypothetical protein
LPVKTTEKKYKNNHQHLFSLIFNTTRMAGGAGNYPWNKEAVVLSRSPVMQKLGSTFYNLIGKRYSTFLGFIVVGAFVFEGIGEGFTDRFWRFVNKGVSLQKRNTFC